MAGIVEPGHGAALRSRPVVERLRLGALHVGFEAAQPEQARSFARRACADRDRPRQCRSYRQGFQASFARWNRAIESDMGPVMRLFRQKPVPSARGFACMRPGRCAPHAWPAPPFCRSCRRCATIRPAHAAVDIALTLLQAGARAIVAGGRWPAGRRVARVRRRMAADAERHRQSTALRRNAARSAAT